MTAQLTGNRLDLERSRDLRRVDEAVAAHGSLVYRLAYRVLQNQADAEDLAQSVFLQLLAAPEVLSRVEHLRAWLARVTLTRSISHSRASHRAAASARSDGRRAGAARNRERGYRRECRGLWRRPSPRSPTISGSRWCFTSRRGSSTARSRAPAVAPRGRWPIGFPAPRSGCASASAGAAPWPRSRPSRRRSGSDRPLPSPTAGFEARLHRSVEEALRRLGNGSGPGSGRGGQGTSPRSTTLGSASPRTLAAPRVLTAKVIRPLGAGLLVTS